MNIKTLIAVGLVALSTAALPAFATEAGPSEHNGPLTRAEVLADLKIYQESGLAEAERIDESGLNTAQREKALARYLALKDSPRFAELVQQFGGKGIKAAAKQGQTTR